MVYYSKETHNLRLTNDFSFSVSKSDEKMMRNEFVAKFWSVDYFYKNENGDLIFQHRHPLYFRNKKTAIEYAKLYDESGLIALLVCHTIDKFHFEWLDFYKVFDNSSIKKLTKNHSFFKSGLLFNEKRKEIPINLDEYKKAKANRKNRVVTDDYGEIIRFKIYRSDRLDVWESAFEYYDENHKPTIKGIRNLDKEYKLNELIRALYSEVFMKSSESVDKDGGCIEMCPEDLKVRVKRYFPKEMFGKIKNMLSKYFDDKYIPKFLSIENKDDKWWEQEATDWWNK